MSFFNFLKGNSLAENNKIKVSHTIIETKASLIMRDLKKYSDKFSDGELTTSENDLMNKILNDIRDFERLEPKENKLYPELNDKKKLIYSQIQDFKKIIVCQEKIQTNLEELSKLNVIKDYSKINQEISRIIKAISDYINLENRNDSTNILEIEKNANKVPAELKPLIKRVYLKVEEINKELTENQKEEFNETLKLIQGFLLLKEKIS